MQASSGLSGAAEEVADVDVGGHGGNALHDEDIKTMVV